MDKDMEWLLKIKYSLMALQRKRRIDFFVIDSNKNENLKICRRYAEIKLSKTKIWLAITAKEKIVNEQIVTYLDSVAFNPMLKVPTYPCSFFLRLSIKSFPVLLFTRPSVEGPVYIISSSFAIGIGPWSLYGDCVCTCSLIELLR